MKSKNLIILLFLFSVLKMSFFRANNVSSDHFTKLGSQFPPGRLRPLGAPKRSTPKRSAPKRNTKCSAICKNGTICTNYVSNGNRKYCGMHKK